jgi:hypothetical protein
MCVCEFCGDGPIVLYINNEQIELEDRRENNHFILLACIVPIPIPNRFLFYLVNNLF